VKITNKIKNDTMYICLFGELDEHTAPNARQTIDACILQGGFGNVVLDLSNLSFMDSTGIGVLLGRYKKIKKLGLTVCIASPSQQTDKLLKLSGIYQVMPKIS
jgi:stage II sporulation protein AA (anti-sigma F factor antagonist)